MSTKPHHIYMVLFLLLAFDGCKKDIIPDDDDNTTKTGYDMVFDEEDVPVLSGMIWSSMKKMFQYCLSKYL